MGLMKAYINMTLAIGSKRLGSLEKEQVKQVDLFVIYLGRDC